MHGSMVENALTIRKMLQVTLSPGFPRVRLGMHELKLQLGSES